MKIIHNTASCNDYCSVFPAVCYQQAEILTTNFEAHAVCVFLYKMILVEGYQKVCKT